MSSVCVRHVPYHAHRGRLRNRACRAAAPADAGVQRSRHVHQRSPHSAPTQADVVSLGNLCVDILVEVDTLPALDTPACKQQLLQELKHNQHPPDAWTTGGGTNFMITAARLGLRVASCGHLGTDEYGLYLQDRLQEEGIVAQVPMQTSPPVSSTALETLVCFILLQRRSGRHRFCSSYDSGPGPIYERLHDGLLADLKAALDASRVVMFNGFLFDELPATVVLQVAEYCRERGKPVFFDPGPRSRTLAERYTEDLDALIRCCSVVLMTEEEAAALTHLSEVDEVCWHLLHRDDSATDWVVIKQGARGALLAQRVVHPETHERRVEFTSFPAFEVDVKDTVGCGDSFAAAAVLGYVRQWKPQHVLALANAVGGATATKHGAGQNVATRAETEELLRNGVADEDPQLQRICSEALHLL